MSQSASHSVRMLAIRAATVAARSVRRLADPVADRLEERGQGEPGVADQPDLHRHDLVEVGRVERGVDVALVGRPLEAVAGLGEARADPEDQVRLAHEHVERTRHGPAARPERQRVVLREGALALEAGRDGRAEQLGQRPELGPGLGVVDALAGVEDRALGGDQRVRGALHVRRVRPVPDRDRRDVARRVGAVLVPDVPRDLDEDRPRPAVAQPGERPPHVGTTVSGSTSWSIHLVTFR